jgi:hypothetical protein
MAWPFLRPASGEGQTGINLKGDLLGQSQFPYHPSSRSPLVLLQVNRSVRLECKAFFLQESPLQFTTADLIGREPSVGVDDPLPGHTSSIMVKDTAHLPGGPGCIGQGRHLSVSQDMSWRNGPYNFQDPLLKNIFRSKWRTLFERGPWPGLFFIENHGLLGGGYLFACGLLPPLRGGARFQQPVNRCGQGIEADGVFFHHIP